MWHPDARWGPESPLLTSGPPGVPPCSHLHPGRRADAGPSHAARQAGVTGHSGDEAYEQVHRLIDRGWSFVGTPTQGLLLRCYDASDAVDTLEVPATGDCLAWRTHVDRTGERVTWRSRGSLDDCVRALLELPEPTEHGRSGSAPERPS